MNKKRDTDIYVININNINELKIIAIKVDLKTLT